LTPPAPRTLSLPARGRPTGLFSGDRVIGRSSSSDIDSVQDQQERRQVQFAWILYTLLLL